MASPLNPNARRVGRRTPQVAQLEAAVRKAKQDAVAHGNRASFDHEGVATFEFGGAKITVRDTDAISAVVAQVRKDLNI